jgi:hypothetical protein
MISVSDEGDPFPQYVQYSYCPNVHHVSLYKLLAFGTFAQFM